MEFKEENASFYDLEYYISLEYRYFSGAHDSRVRNILAAILPIRGQAVLDVGCGSGYFVDVFRREGARAVGIDYSLFSARFAQLRYPGIDCRQLSAYALTSLPESSFDVVTLLDVIEHMSDHERLFAGIRHVLRPGGRLLISTDFEDSRWNSGPLKRLIKASQILSSEGRAYRLIKKVERHRKQFRNYHASHIAELSYEDLRNAVIRAGFREQKHEVYPLVGVSLRDWALKFLPRDYRGDHQLIVATKTTIS